MGFLTTALIVGVVGAGVASLLKDSIKEIDRKGTPCNFDNGIDKETFYAIIEKECQAINRIENYQIDGTLIRAKVRSQSGISEWKFTIDYNDYGKITGNYWITSKNSDSKIPETLANRIKQGIMEYLREFESIN